MSKKFGGIRAVSDVSFSVERGEVLGLVGPNGAGKTTLFDCACGQINQDEGSIYFDGQRIDDLSSHKRARRGIGRTFQRVEVFPELSVRDHLMVAERARAGDGRLWRDLLNLSAPKPDEVGHVDAILALVGLGDVADTVVGALGLGFCRLVELARALIGEPRLLMADEPSSGLDARETAALAKTLRSVQQQRGMSILLVEHDLSMVGQTVDRVVVLDAGQMVTVGTFDEVMADPSVHEVYVGRAGDQGGLRAKAFAAPPPSRRPAKLPTSPARARRATKDQPPGSTSTTEDDVSKATAGVPTLELDNVSAAYGPYRALFGVSFSIPAGGVVALLGSNGAGKSTVARVVSGLVPATSGRVRLDGADITGRPTWRISREGVVHVPEGRGIFSTLDVEENLVLSLRRRVGRAALGDALERAYEAFPILAERRRQRAGTLSGGQQRILSLAKVLVVRPKLLIADELSLGLAPIVITSVYEALAAIQRAGTALLLVEQHLDRVLELADRAVILEKGTVRFDGPAIEAETAMNTVLTPAPTPDPPEGSP